MRLVEFTAARDGAPVFLDPTAVQLVRASTIDADKTMIGMAAGEGCLVRGTVVETMAKLQPPALGDGEREIYARELQTGALVLSDLVRQGKASPQISPALIEVGDMLRRIQLQLLRGREGGRLPTVGAQMF